MSTSDEIWQRLELGGEPPEPEWLRIWRRHRGHVLDVAGGHGRIANALRGHGAAVTVLDRCAGEIRADACDFEVDERYRLVICAGGALHLFADRRAFFACAREALTERGRLAVHIYEWTSFFGSPQPALAIEHAGHRYELQPLSFLREDTSVRYRYLCRLDGAEVARHDVALAWLSRADVIEESGLAFDYELEPSTVQPSRIMVFRK